jgi:lipoprotein-releasing system permease protein
MINKFTLWLAAKCWFASPKERPVFIMSLFGIIGITIGVAALVIVMSVMNGFRVELEQNIRGLSSDINIVPLDSRYIEEHQDIQAKLKEDKNIIHINNIIGGQGLISSEYTSSGVMFMGMTFESLSFKKQIINNILLGNFNDFTNDRSIAIGIELARKLNVTIGDFIKLTLPSSNNSLFGPIPKMKEFEIVAIYNSKLYEYDLGTVILNYNIASKLLSTNNNPNLIEVDILRDRDVNQDTEIIKKNLIDFQVNITNWQKKNEQFLHALKVERVAMFCVLSLIVFVAMFNVLSGLFMTVKDKKYDIAILRSLGVSKSEIMISFMLYGFFIGCVGITLGITIGKVIAGNIESIKQFLEFFSGYKIFEPAVYFLSYLPSKVLFSDLLLISGMTILISLLGSIYPAYKAANMSTIEALRYE